MKSQRQEQDTCPVSDGVMGEVYRSSPQHIRELVETIPPFTRALLAMYCRGHDHLASMGLTIAMTCDKGDLIEAGGERGAALFDQARQPRRDLLKLVAQDLI